MEQKTLKQQIVNGRAWCSFHQRWESSDGFDKSSSSLNGLQYSCKEGKRIYNKRTNNGRNLGYYIVYELSDGYIGLTNRPYFRMSHHKSVGRIKSLNDYTELAKCPTSDEARNLEALYQSQSPYYNYKPDAKSRLNKPQ